MGRAVVDAVVQAGSSDHLIITAMIVEAVFDGKFLAVACAVGLIALSNLIAGCWDNSTRSLQRWEKERQGADKQRTHVAEQCQHAVKPRAVNARRLIRLATLLQL